MAGASINRRLLRGVFSCQFHVQAQGALARRHFRNRAAACDSLRNRAARLVAALGFVDRSSRHLSRRDSWSGGSPRVGRLGHLDALPRQCDRICASAATVGVLEPPKDGCSGRTERTTAALNAASRAYAGRSSVDTTNRQDVRRPCGRVASFANGGGRLPAAVPRGGAVAQPVNPPWRALSQVSHRIPYSWAGDIFEGARMEQPLLEEPPYWFPP